VFTTSRTLLFSHRYHTVAEADFPPDWSLKTRATFQVHRTNFHAIYVRPEQCLHLYKTPLYLCALRRRLTSSGCVPWEEPPLSATS
jgi:hypothetical protein